MNTIVPEDVGLNGKECEWLSMFCASKQIKSALEFGPGNSTQAMIDGGVEFIKSFEQDAFMAEKMRNLLPGDKVEIITYDPTAIPLEFDVHGRVDMAFIDGPTRDAFTPSRLNAALFCFNRAQYIVMHDAYRDYQTAMVMTDLGMNVVEDFESDRGIIVLSKDD